MKRKTYLWAALSAALLCAAANESALADKLCLKATNPRGKKVDLRVSMVAESANCPRGYKALTTGAQLVDLPPSIYGDGSAGAKTVSANEEIEAILDVSNAPNLQFTDVTIAAGQTWTVPSGTVIRCTGTFTNNGTLAVSLGAAGEYRPSDSNAAISEQGDAPADSGIALRAAGHGQFGDNSTIDLRGGTGGQGPSVGQMSQMTAPGASAGGGGGAGGPDSCAMFFGPAIQANGGSAGGGAVTILCQGGIVNNGTITSNGSNGEDNSLLFPCDYGGGGGGGVVILASKTSITNAGTIEAKGGNGEAPDSNEAGSGGGGGGLVRLVSPAVTNSGAVNVAGGTGGGGGAAGTIGGSPAFGGGGGGASAGSGGSGGGVVQADASTTAPGDGGTGALIITRADPTGMF